MKAWRKRLVDRLALGLLRLVIGRLRRQPLAEVYRRGERFGRLIPKVLKSRKRRAEANLALAFPDMGAEERDAMVVRIFEHFGRAGADFLVSEGRTKADIEATMEFEGVHHLDEALARGKGVMFVSGHIGNWERSSSWLSLSGYPLTAIARDANQEGVNQLVNHIRQSSGTKIVPRGDAARSVLGCLKRNELVAILADQNAEEVFIPFFGHLAGTVLGPGVLAARTGATVVPAYCVYAGDGRWKCVFDAPIEALEGYETNGEGMMRAIHLWLEGVIREYPDQWLWFHDRWRNARERGLLDE